MDDADHGGRSSSNSAILPEGLLRAVSRVEFAGCILSAAVLISRQQDICAWTGEN